MSSARPIINLVTGKNATKIAHPPHPYYPLEIEIAGYLANDYSVPQLLFFFAAGCAVILAFTHYVAKARNPGLPPSEIVRIMWFVLCKFQDTRG
jgi:cholestenol delta-isomerase